jgi:predicted phosphodiesterase
MSRILVIGDVHATPQELPDCEALLRLVKETIASNPVDGIVLLGDQFNTHDILNTRCVDFWNRFLDEIANDRREVAVLVGNHDQLTPTIRGPHSMISFRDKNHVSVVDSPQMVSFWDGDNFYDMAMMPYYANPVEFIEEATKLKTTYPDLDLLFCHQTFGGADVLGFYSKDSVEPTAVPFKTIISGHIHKPMRFGKVWYPGSPRWRTLSDVDVETRAIHIVEDGVVVKSIPTNTHCTRIYKFSDSEDCPLHICLTPDELTRADLRITISGTADYISKRTSEFKAKYNARCQGVPTRSRLSKVSESEGIYPAFTRFGINFTPPNGSDKETLLRTANERLR